VISDKGLLFIEPGQHASPTPVIDDITRKMCAAFRRAKRSDYAYGGVHECLCGALSTACDYRLPNGDVTNSLCVHYAAHHRPEVPPGQLARIRAFPFRGDEPNERELQGPDLILKGVRASVERILGPDRLRTWVMWGLDAEALCRGLRGGCLPSMAGLTEVRKDADALFSLLSCVKAEELPHVRESIRRSHGDLPGWATGALRIPGWSRELWAAPLADLLRLPPGNTMDRRVVAMSLRLLGRHAGATVPTLLELAEGAAGDLLYDVLLGLTNIGRTPEVLVPAATVPELVRIARRPSSDPGLRIAAARLLGCTGLATEAAVTVLLELALTNRKVAEYAEAVLCGTLHQQYGYVGEPGVAGWGRVGLPILLESLQDPDVNVRRRAIKLLGRLGPEARAAAPALKRAGEDPQVLSQVEESLLRINSPDSAESAIEEKRAADKAKAVVTAPPLDPKQARHSQFFRFTCPFCSHCEVVGLWHTLKTCSKCQKSVRIVRQLGRSGCEPNDSPGAAPGPPEGE
jgi:hypothetical protein